MKFPVRQYSKGRINRAGDELVGSQETDETFAVINNWKSCHSYPLQVVKMTLSIRAKAVESSPLIAQRIKRLPSIFTKLRRERTMKLSQMQDLGGCRAVMKNMSSVNALVRKYHAARLKNPSKSDIPRDRPVIDDCENDYISNPKPDGYRSYHLICRYYSRVKDKQVFNGQRIEIQIRTRLQHSWATAVEVVEAFSKNALKTKSNPSNDSLGSLFCTDGNRFCAKREKTNCSRHSESQARTSEGIASN